METDLDLDLDNYKLSELLNIYKLSYLPDNESIIDDIYNSRIKSSKISLEVKNFLLNIKMRLKMEIRDKNKKKELEKEKKKEKVELKFEKQTRSTYLCIDSRFRNNYFNTSSNDFVIDLPYEFNNVIKLGLMSIEIINSITTLTVESENNTFDISYNSDATGLRKTITETVTNADTGEEEVQTREVGRGATDLPAPILPSDVFRIVIEDGNYASDAFSTEINNDFDAAIGNGFMSISFNKNTGKTKIQSNEADGRFTVYFDENRKEPFNTLGYKMGFRKTKYIDKHAITSESLFDLTGEKYFFLYVDDYNCNYYKDTIISIQNNDYLTKNILGRITMGGEQYSVVYEDTSDLIKKERQYSGPVNLKKLHIKLLNVYGNVANINEIDFSIIFEIVQKTTS